MAKQDTFHDAGHDLGPSRRDLIRGAGAAGGLSLLAALTGGSAPAHAQPVKGPVPEVDRLAVRVVTDSFQQAIAPPMQVNGVRIERYSFDVRPERGPSRSLLSEFGLSLHLNSQRGAEERNVLIDFGYTPTALLNNMAALGIDPTNLDALVLSHGHFDHFGGMVGFLDAYQGKLKKDIPFFLGGEECFCTRELTLGGNVNQFGYLDRAAIERAQLKVVLAERPSIVADHAFTTGHIAANTFEKVLAPTRFSVGIKDGAGCYPERMPENKRTAIAVPDDFAHEQATCFNVKGRGLVVITSCGHRGIVNSVKRAQAVSGVDKVHAVMGGFHLAPHTAEYVGETVAALKAINPDIVLPMHCTGEPFHDIMAREMPGKLARSYTGSRYTFGA